MTRTNIAQFKSQLCEFLGRVEGGESVEICRRNRPIARVTPIVAPHENRTVLGCGKGTVVVHGDLTGPVLDDWEMNAACLDR
jgi:prevent-host-death family protein